MTNSLIADRAMARNIELSPDGQQRLTMDVAGTTRWFNGAKSNLNTALARRCALHKDVTSRMLRSYKLNAPENAVFSPGESERAWAWAQPILPLVVKPNSGGSGEAVYLDIKDKESFDAAFEAVSQVAREVLVEQFLQGEEHRVLMVYGKVAAAARRMPAHVIGDGRSSVATLIEAKNRERVRSENPTHFELLADEVTVLELRRQELSLGSVVDEGAYVWLRSNSNVHSGGDGVDATDELLPAEIEMAERSMRAIPGLRLAGLDMLLPRNGKGTEPYILEINSSPQISGHHFPWYGQERDVAGLLLDSMFK